jgi:release factor glutamine methyltransferase
MNHAASDKSRPINWTTRKLLDWTGGYLESRGVDSPRLAAEMLLAQVLGVGRVKLYMDLDRPASPLERAAYRELVERAAAHEPVQYLVGKAHFFSMELAVNGDVLIPRPSTETLVEHVIQHARRTPGFAQPAVADIGTGSGAIAIAVARHLPEARVIATDPSAKALEVAKDNARRLEVADRVEFRRGRFFEPLLGERFTYVLSNPPYISDARWKEVAANVKDYEPTDALRAGAEGLDCLRVLVEGACDYLADPGQLVLEIASDQAAAVKQLIAEVAQLTNPRVLADHEGHDRVVVADHR